MTLRRDLWRVGVLPLGLTTLVQAGHAAGTAIVANADGLVTFVMPSLNIECTYVPPGGTPTYKPPLDEAELSCDRAEPAYVNLSIGAHGPAKLVRDPGEQPCCGVEPRLEYGQSARLGPFTRCSERAGLTCPRDGGVGFIGSSAAASRIP